MVKRGFQNPRKILRMAGMSRFLFKGRIAWRVSTWSKESVLKLWFRRLYALERVSFWFVTFVSLSSMSSSNAVLQGVTDNSDPTWRARYIQWVSKKHIIVCYNYAIVPLIGPSTLIVIYELFWTEEVWFRFACCQRLMGDGQLQIWTHWSLGNWPTSSTCTEFCRWSL